MKTSRYHYGNLAKHGVTVQEIKECLRRGSVKYLRRVGYRKYKVIAQTLSGRYLEVMYLDFPEDRFVFHAIDAKPRHIKLFKRRGKRQ